MTTVMTRDDDDMSPDDGVMTADVIVIAVDDESHRTVTK